MSEVISSAFSDNAQIRISSVRREHGKATLTLSNGEIRVMPRALLKERPYKGGMPFDDESFSLLIKERSYPFAMDKAISLLSMRARTEKEIVDALRRNVYPEETIARVMQRLHEAGYINDSDFAAQFSASRTSRGMGTMRIRMELRKKGVDHETIEETLSFLDRDDILSSAIRMAKKAAQGKDMNDRADRQKILSALARRGYDFQTARQALETLRQEE